jgi:RHS repeat-associated protein
MAGHRPTDWHVLDLDKDPVPGDPQQVRQLAKKLHDFADDVSDALRLVKGMAGETTLAEWAGKSADVFKEDFADVPKNLRKLEKSYSLCGDALADYWPKLERAQALADRALVKGREAQSDLSSAKSRLSSADSWMTRASKEADKYKDDPTGSKATEKPDEAKVRAATRDVQHAEAAQVRAQSDVTTAQNALDAAKKMAEDARKMREEAARTAKSKIDEASDAGIQNRSWWEDIGDWFVDNWDTIVAVCKVVVAVVGVIAMIIGGPILAAIVVVAGLVVLADSLYKYSKGQAGLLDVAFAAMDCVPGMKGLTTLGKLAMGAKALGKGGLKAMAKGLGKKGLRREADDAVARSKPTKGRCKNGDPIDMVTGEMIMAKTDFALAGLLPMVLRRTHLSTYQSGQLFGPSWASTLDERLELDVHGAVFATEDGMILSYPAPVPDAVVLPVEGPRWPLEWESGTDTPLRISDPQTGHVRHFAPLDNHGSGHGAFTLALRAISDRNGHRITIDRAADGTPMAMRHTGGHHVAVDCQGGRVRALRLLDPETALGTELVRYGYDDRGNLTEIYNSSGVPYRLSYDEDARITSWTDRKGSWYRFTYDGLDRVISGEGADGFLNCTVAYDPEARRTRYTDSLGFTTTYEYNDLLQVVAESDPLGNVRRSEWDRYNNLVATTDAMGLRTSYQRNEHGTLIGVIRPDGRRISATVNELQLPIQVVEADGAVWSYQYDSRGNVVTVTDPVGALTTYRYDETGHLRGVTDPLGAERVFECDPLGLPVGVTDPFDGTTRYKRDIFGRIISVSDPLGGTTSLTWNVEGKLTTRTGPEGGTESWTYDGEGRLVEHRAVGGGVTRFESNHFGVPKARIDAEGARVEFSHDTELRLTAARNPHGAIWSYVHDAAGRVTAETDFNGRTLTYSYDAAGRLVERTNGAQQTTRFVRDALGKVVEQRSGDQTTSYVYDAAGRLEAARNEHTEIGFTRDPLGRVVEESCNGLTSTATYDSAGRRTGFATPGGAPAFWEYDAENRPTALSTARWSMAFRYDEAGHEVERALFPRLVLTQDWDESHRLVRQGIEGVGSSWHRTFSYHADGLLAASTDHDGRSRSLAVDRLGRVTGLAGPEGMETYAYDATGRVVEAMWPSGAGAASLDSGEAVQGVRHFGGTLLHRAGRTSFEYDAQGRTVRKTQKLLSGKTRTWTYAWDAEDRLIGVAVPDGTSWQYQYDPLGRRVEKRHRDANGNLLARVMFVWDGARIAEQVRIDERTGDRTITTWLWKPDSMRPLAQSECRIPADAPQDEIDARFYAIVTDLTGTPTELVDEAGMVVWRSATNLWGSGIGALTADSGSGPACPLRFPGQYHDEETGLHYNHFRYYEPETSRYQSPDPLGLAPAIDHHGYVPNPTAWVDPLGLSCDEEEEWTRVGRWMSDDEYNKMVQEGRVQPGAGDRSYVANPPDPAAYGRQAAPGTSYVEYDVPLSSLRPGGEPGWSQIAGPNSMFARLAERRGEPRPEFPEVRNIEKIISKEDWARGAG